MRIAIIGTAYPYRGRLASYNERLTSELLKKPRCNNIFVYHAVP